MAGGWSTSLRGLDLVYGAGCLETLGQSCARLGGRRILVVSDPGIDAAGHVEVARQSIEAEGLKVSLFEGVGENPTEEHVAEGAEAARAHEADLLVGLGGGSAMDCAKGINFVYSNGGKMEDYWGFGKATKPMLPSIGVPSTAGTGSEAQSFALISREDDHRKMACGDEKARFREVLLDPRLAATAPPEVVAVTGLDAISHAIESAVSKTGNPLSNLFAEGAWKRLTEFFPGVVAASNEEVPKKEPDQVADRWTVWGEMLIGAHFAGAAIELSMLGAAHALANPLTARYGVTHGAAVALVLPAVIRFNAETVGDQYDRLAPRAGLGGVEGGASGEFLAQRVETLRQLGGLPASLSQVEIPEHDLSSLAEQAAQQWTAGFNPRPVGQPELLNLYQRCYG